MLKVYIADLYGMPDPKATPAFKERLGPARYEDLLRYVKEENRIEQCGKWFLLEKVLKEEGISPEEETILTGKCGKPYLKSEKVHFNISHSGRFVMCAVSDRKVGCDTQECVEFNESFIKRCYSKAERAWAGNDSVTYTKLWTLKESFYKYLGTGISEDLKNASFSLLKKEKDREFYRVIYHGKERNEHFCLWEKEDFSFCLCCACDFDTMFDNPRFITYNDIC